MWINQGVGYTGLYMSEDLLKKIHNASPLLVWFSVHLTWDCASHPLAHGCTTNVSALVTNHQVYMLQSEYAKDKIRLRMTYGRPIVAHKNAL